MDYINKNQIQWACRRGMRELDLLIMPFFEAYYDGLSKQQQKVFVELLSYPDPTLFSWLMYQQEPPKIELKEIIQLIRTRNSENGYVAL